jgi:hypothetical protein
MMTLSQLPEDLGGDANLRWRKRLAQQFIQRRRADIRHYLDSDTPFPERRKAKQPTNSPGIQAPVRAGVGLCPRDGAGPERHAVFRQRVRWWSALALLRSLASSPAAAAATLRNRAATVDAETPEEADEIGQRTVLDLMEDESAEGH